ncbi:MAG TPA: Shedu anti-phage system protein SduA domain-containing protein [Gemmataceae bacterium]|nr:Shedu anti-phage system protein SduA domain-containing protein [Gemmataceae bacterium]
MRTLGRASDFVFEFPFVGDCSADLIVGDKALGIICVVEFEDGRGESIFNKPQIRSTKEWCRRFEHGFSQIVDWFCMLDDAKKSERFKKDFGPGHVRFSGLLIIGRDAGLTEYERFRLRWRTEKVGVDNHSVECITFDVLHRHMDQHLQLNTSI